MSLSFFTPRLPARAMPLAVALLLSAAFNIAFAEGTATTALYTGEAWSNVGGGGRSSGERYLSNLVVGANIPLSGESGSGSRSRVYLSALHNTGELFSGELVGDTQLVSNIEANRATRVFEAYYEYQSDDGRSSWLIGLWDLNSEIDVIEPATLFLNSSQGIGAEYGTSGRNGPSIFPITSLALRWRKTVNERLALRAAILDGVPGNPSAPDRPRARFQLGDGDGALLSGEAEYAFDERWIGKLGLWHYTARRDRLQDDTGDTSAPDDDAETGRAQGVYASLSGTLLQARGSDSRLEGFARLGLANGEVQQIGSYVGAGLVWSGFSNTLSDEKVGLAVAHANTRSVARRLGDERSETSLELTFSTRLTPWLRLQPNLQYVINPGFDQELDDTLVLGLRLELSGRYVF